MLAKEHCQNYLTAVAVFSFFLLKIGKFEWLIVYALLVAFFCINPDNIDNVLPETFHRQIVSHSIVWPVIVYFGWRKYLEMELLLDGTDLMKEFGIIIFYAMLVHLICDFFNIYKKVQGHATIKIWDKDIGRVYSLLWVGSNIVGICTYILIVL